MSKTVLNCSAPLGIALCITLLPAVNGCGPSREIPAQPNVVIIVMDTTRQDHLSCYGHERSTTPNLDQLCREASRYTRAWSTSAWTPPAHASLFTGLYASAHGTTQRYLKMTFEVTTLAEILRDEGYDCIGIAENPMLLKSRRFSQGFKRWHQCWTMPEAETNHALELFRSELAERNSNRPLFTFINLIEPHGPYDSSRQFMNRFVTDETCEIVSNHRSAFLSGEIDISPAEMEHLRQLYDAEILYTDYLIGKIIDELKEDGIWRDTLFIVTSDHGENFGEHGLVGHVFSLYESVTRIPLIVHWPRPARTSGLDDRPVQLVDIFPTVLGLAGVDVTRFPHQGLDLLAPEWPSRRAVVCEYDYPDQALSLFSPEQMMTGRLEVFKRKLASVVLGDLKLISADGEPFEFYDLAADPDEKTNLIEEEAYAEARLELSDLLAEALRRFAAPLELDTPDETETMDAATEEALRSLGYVR